MSWYNDLEERDRLSIKKHLAAIRASDTPRRFDAVQRMQQTLDVLVQMKALLPDVPTQDLIEELKCRGWKKVQANTPYAQPAICPPKEGAIEDVWKVDSKEGE